MITYIFIEEWELIDQILKGWVGIDNRQFFIPPPRDSFILKAF